ncbi:MAG: hypothetical protein HRU07_06800 [Nitrosopumilus sp.]|nr:hypothetical protein [Nitrosopumilus sp.]NRA05847.1 hypothetical protein [Nitrosopumilus sp.]
MSKSGYFENVYSLSKEERTLCIPNQPQLTINGFYTDSKRQKCPILNLVWITPKERNDIVIILEQIELDKDNSIDLRLRYYIIGEKPRMRGKWVFGQFATFVSPNDFKKLVKLAKKHKMF